MNLLYYCDWFEQYTADLALAVAAESPNVSLIVREQAPEFTGQGHREDATHLRGRLQSELKNLYVLGGSHRSLTSLPGIRKIVQQCRPDFFHLQQTADPRFLWIVFRVPTALTLHEPFARAGNGHQRNRTLRARIGSLTQRIYRHHCDLIIVHTKDGLASLSPAEKRKAVLIPHGVATVPITTADPDSETILFFGRADGYKGLDTLLEAMEKVWRRRPNARLRILASPGGFHYRPSDPRITATWNGFTNKELAEAMSEARAVCLPYTSSAGSGVAAQAYGAGRPIVASDIDGLRELISHDELAFKPNDADDLARALVEVLTHDYGPQPIDPNRSWTKVAHTHLDAYQHAVQRTRKPA